MLAALSLLLGLTAAAFAGTVMFMTLRDSWAKVLAALRNEAVPAYARRSGRRIKLVVRRQPAAPVLRPALSAAA